ncbi:MAG: sulfotransferase, partial [Bacteroidota bacterium]
PKLVTPDFGDYPNEHCLYSYSDEIKKYAYQTVLAWSKWTKEGKYSVDEQTKKLTATIGDGIINYFTDELNADELLLFKTPDSGNIQDFFHLFPSEKVILLIRDGRDTVESFLKSWGGTALFKKMTIRWKNRMNQIERFMEQSKQSGFMDQLLLVNYEDLNATTEKELTKIFDFIDLDKKLYPWDDLEKIPILGSSTYRGDEAKVNWKPVEKKSDFNPSKKWENWSARKKRTFKKIAGDELINFGFAKDQRW